MRWVSFIFGILWIMGMSYSSDFSTFADFLAYILIYTPPVSFILIPVFLEYKERNK